MKNHRFKNLNISSSKFFCCSWKDRSNEVKFDWRVFSSSCKVRKEIQSFNWSLTFFRWNLIQSYFSFFLQKIRNYQINYFQICNSIFQLQYSIVFLSKKILAILLNMTFDLLFVLKIILGLFVSSFNTFSSLKMWNYQLTISLKINKKQQCFSFT